MKKLITLLVLLSISASASPAILKGKTDEKQCDKVMRLYLASISVTSYAIGQAMRKSGFTQEQIERVSKNVDMNAPSTPENEKEFNEAAEALGCK